MLKLGVEAVLLLQIGVQPVEDGFVHVLHAAAPAADQVVVVSFAHGVVDESAAAQVALRHEALCLEQLKCAVDGGDVEVGVLVVSLLEDFLGADVVVAGFYGLKHHHALRGHAKAFSPQLAEDGFPVT